LERGIIGVGNARELAVHSFHAHLILSLSKDVSARQAKAVRALFFLALPPVSAPLIRILRQAQDEACLWRGIDGIGNARELAVHPFHAHLILSLTKDVSARQAKAV
jgi:hypothetical protein